MASAAHIGRFSSKVATNSKILKVKSHITKKVAFAQIIWVSFRTFANWCPESTQKVVWLHRFFEKNFKKSFFNREIVGVKLRKSKYLPRWRIVADGHIIKNVVFFQKIWVSEVIFANPAQSKGAFYRERIILFQHWISVTHLTSFFFFNISFSISTPPSCHVNRHLILNHLKYLLWSS